MPGDDQRLADLEVAGEISALQEDEYRQHLVGRARQVGYALHALPSGSGSWIIVTFVTVLFAGAFSIFFR